MWYRFRTWELNPGQAEISINLVFFRKQLFFSGQMLLLDRFFDGTFFTYGIEVMSFADRDQEDRIGKC